MQRLPLASLLLAAASMSLSACYSNPSKFNKDIAKRTCDWYYECYRASAEQTYSSYDDCVDTARDGYEDSESRCSYNDEEARACMKWVKDNQDNCSLNFVEAAAELFDQCKDVYYDCELGYEVEDTDGVAASFPAETSVESMAP